MAKAAWLILGVEACSGSSTEPSVGVGGAASSIGGSFNDQGGSNATGGAVTPSNGGRTTGGNSTGGKATGGAITASTGGSATGSGGSATGGTITVSNGGIATGGATTGGSATSGTGGRSTGGNATGGAIVATTGGRAAGGTTGNAGTAATSTILEPATGALLGVFYGDASIAATATKIGRTPPLHLTYYAFSDDWTSGNTVQDLAAGRIPFVNWELFGATLEDIAGGTYDTLLNQRATSAKNLGKKLFVDLGAEMNGDWSPWSGALNGESSAKYIAAYRHVHDIFVATGATNVIWAFCPNVTSEPVEDWNEALDYYPGDSYVDWTCVDGYNWGTSTTWGRWQSFYDVFKDFYAILATKNKPIIIGEMASTELGGDKAAWIAGIIPTMQADFPLLKGLVWFDINKETDWRISSSAASEAAFKAMATDPWFAP